MSHRIREQKSMLNAAASRMSIFKRIPTRKDTFSHDEDFKKKITEIYAADTAVLQHRQCQYKRRINANNTINTKSDMIMAGATGHRMHNVTLRKQKNDLKAKLWVANGVTYRQKNKEQLVCVEDSALCQEKLAREIQFLKSSLKNIEHQISVEDRRIFAITQNVTSNFRHIAVVAEARKQIQMFENHLENKVRRECYYTADNNKLRNELKQLLDDRTNFNTAYRKLMQQLTNDKKYLFEIIEYAMRVFDKCIETYEKIEHHHKKILRDKSQLINEYVDVQRKQRNLSLLKGFMELKLGERILAPLEPREIKRRENCIRNNMKAFARYRRVFAKLRKFTGQTQIEEMVTKYKEQESVYYSYYSYANELGYHMTLLNSSVNILYDKTRAIRQEVRDTLRDQINRLLELETLLGQKRKRNDELQLKCDKLEFHLEALMQEIAFIYGSTKMDATPLMLLFGDSVNVDMKGMRYFLQKLERRLHDIVAFVYCVERESPIRKLGSRGSSVMFEDENRRPVSMLTRTVKGIDKMCDWKTHLSDIVLAQQCPECAEGEAFIHESDSSKDLRPLTTVETKRNLYEKIVQPEMQYRLHPINECRMPRSRFLSAKKSNIIE